MIAVGILLGLAVGVAAYFVVSEKARKEGREAEARALMARTSLAQELAAARAAAEANALVTRRELELAAREQLKERRRRADEDARNVEALIAGQALELETKERALETRQQVAEERAAALLERDQILKDREAQTKALRDEAEQATRERDAALERLAGESGVDIRQRLVNEWIEAAKGSAAEKLRRIDAGINDPEHGRSAKRIMEIAIARYQGHYLTERMLTNLPIVPDTLPKILGEDNVNLLAIEEISHVKLTPSETGENIRLEGQDSFGREIARRSIARFARNPPKPADVQKQVKAIAEELDREVFELGKRAFKELEIPRAHPDIVKLVGKLNYRTSYTQNQWKHAIEASFICGMMASELGLDVKLARRAALMHDIGKALTHEIDGSHAVIGADLARKLGETEVVANAIGAHHTDEPFNSVYAYLVAAGDAMSGGRPGARRQQDDNYAERLEALTHIAGSFPGVERVYPVFGGREVRVHVQEGRVSDEKAVELSSQIAHRISDEMTFPGQIKVTVIRELRAVEIAG